MMSSCCVGSSVANRRLVVEHTVTHCTNRLFVVGQMVTHCTNLVCGELMLQHLPDSDGLNLNWHLVPNPISQW